MSNCFKTSKALLLLFFASIPIILAAQDFRPGFIITTGGDSISGFVANRSAKRSTKECRFKTSKSSKVVRYKPTDLKSYGIFGYKLYRSKEISITGTKQSTFLEVLVTGKMSLLATNDAFFFEKDSLVFLPKATKVKVQENGRVFIKPERYIGVLNIAMAECNKVVGQPSYNETAFVDLFMRYNECKGQPALEVKGKIPRNRITWNIMSGLDNASTKADADKEYGGHIEIKQFQIRKSVSIPVGLGFEWSRPRHNDRVFGGVELWYDKKIFQGYAEQTKNGATLRSDLLMDVSYLKMPVSLRLNLRAEKNTPYLRFGYTHYFTLSASSRYRDESESDGVVFTTLDKTPVKKKAGDGFWLGAGYSLQLFRGLTTFVEARYEVNTGFTFPTPSSHSSGSALSFLIGLKF